MTQIQIDWSRAVETARHNVATEKQAAAELGETHRHNVVGENETRRHNIAGENENVRHNKASENETNRHNVVTEKETKRHNKKSETQEDKRIKETKRHNKKTEKQEDKRIGETKRHNKTSEAQESSKINLQKQRTEAEVRKANAEVRNINAKSVAQELANAADQSDPTLYKANRFVKVFQVNAPAAWAYYGLDTLSSDEQDTVNKEASKTNPNNAKIINIIDKANVRKNGRHLTKSERQGWEKVFNFGSGDGWRTNDEVNSGKKPTKKTNKTSKSTKTKGTPHKKGGSGGKLPVQFTI